MYKIGIVGTGAIARSMHIPVLLKFEDVRIEAVADSDPVGIKKVVRKWNIKKSYSDYEKMF